MTDFIISDGHEDIEFVHNLHDHLTELGREFWIDWKDVTLTGIPDQVPEPLSLPSNAALNQSPLLVAACFCA